MNNVTVILDKTYQLWEVAARDDSRPVLSGICIRANGTANAADGFMLATVPCKVEGDLSADDAEVVIPAAFLKDAVKRTAKHEADVRFHILDGRVYTMDHTLAADLIEGTYPNFSGAIPSDASDFEPLAGVAFNQKLLAYIVKGLGRDKPGIVPLYFSKKNRVIIIPGADNRGIALLMPMFIELMKPERLTEWLREQKRFDWHLYVNGTTQMWRQGEVKRLHRGDPDSDYVVLDRRHGDPLDFSTEGDARRRLTYLMAEHPECTFQITTTFDPNRLKILPPDRFTPDLSEWDYTPNEEWLPCDVYISHLVGHYCPAHGQVFNNGDVQNHTRMPSAV